MPTEAVGLLSVSSHIMHPPVRNVQEFRSETSENTLNFFGKLQSAENLITTLRGRSALEVIRHVFLASKLYRFP